MTHIGKPWEAVRHDQTAACQRGVVSPKLKIKLAYRCVPTRRGFVAGRDFASTGSRAILPSALQ
jgi:hypothetical protein